MYRSSIFIKSFTFIALMLSAVANAAGKVSEGEVYRYLELSGFKTQIQALPAQIQAMSQQMQLTSKDAAKDKAVMDILVEAWQEDRIYQKVISSIQSNFTPAEMTELLATLNSKTMKSIKMAELKGASPDLQQEIMGFMANIQQNPPTPERQKLVRDFLTTTNATSYSVDVAMAIVENMFAGFQAAMPEKKIPAEQLDQQLVQMRQMMGAMMDQQMVMMSYYMYADISDAELAKYTNFYKQPLGKKELKAVYAGLLDGMNLWGDDIVKSLVKHMKESKS